MDVQIQVSGYKYQLIGHNNLVSKFSQTHSDIRFSYLRSIREQSDTRL